MGCDIHLVLERKLPQSSDWIGIWTSDQCPGYHEVSRRDYELFSNLAGVRGSPDQSKGGLYARFIPGDISALALEQVTRYGTDGHSHSHLDLDEFCRIWRACNDDRESARHAHLAYDLFGVDSEYPGRAKYRVVFWFDN